MDNNLRRNFEVCPRCGGVGSIQQNNASVSCPNCQGTGAIKLRRSRRQLANDPSHQSILTLGYRGWLIGAGVIIALFFTVSVAVLAKNPMLFPSPTKAASISVLPTSTSMLAATATSSSPPTATYPPVATYPPTTVVAPGMPTPTPYPTYTPIPTYTPFPANTAIPPTATTAPSAVIVDDSVIGSGDNQCQYFGGWTHAVDLPPNYHNTVSRDPVPGDNILIAFTGTRIQAFAPTNPMVGIASYSLDGGTAIMIDQYSATPKFNQLVFDSGTLARGHHVLRIVVTGTKNAASSAQMVSLDDVIIQL